MIDLMLWKRSILHFLTNYSPASMRAHFKHFSDFVAWRSSSSYISYWREKDLTFFFHARCQELGFWLLLSTLRSLPWAKTTSFWGATIWTKILPRGKTISGFPIFFQENANRSHNFHTILSSLPHHAAHPVILSYVNNRLEVSKGGGARSVLIKLIPHHDLIDPPCAQPHLLLSYQKSLRFWLAKKCLIKCREFEPPSEEDIFDAIINFPVGRFIWLWAHWHRPCPSTTTRVSGDFGSKSYH